MQHVRNVSKTKRTALILAATSLAVGGGVFAVNYYGVNKAYAETVQATTGYVSYEVPTSELIAKAYSGPNANVVNEEPREGTAKKGTANAVLDGNLGTFWSSKWSDRSTQYLMSATHPVYLEVCSSTNQPFQRLNTYVLKLRNMNEPGGTNGRPKDFAVELKSSPESDWQKIYEGSRQTNDLSDIKITFPTQSVYCARIAYKNAWVNDGNSDIGAAAAEVRLQYTDPATHQTERGKFRIDEVYRGSNLYEIASDTPPERKVTFHNAAEAREKAIDNDPTTYWSGTWQGASNYLAQNQYSDLEICLKNQGVKEINAVHFQTRRNEGGSGRPKDYEVYLKGDTDEWKMIAKGTRRPNDDSLTGNSNPGFYINFTKQNVKCVRMRYFSVYNSVNGVIYNAPSMAEVSFVNTTWLENPEIWLNDNQSVKPGQKVVIKEIRGYDDNEQVTVKVLSGANFSTEATVGTATISDLKANGLTLPSENVVAGAAKIKLELANKNSDQTHTNTLTIQPALLSATDTAKEGKQVEFKVAGIAADQKPVFKLVKDSNEITLAAESVNVQNNVATFKGNLPKEAVAGQYTLKVTGANIPVALESQLTVTSNALAVDLGETGEDVPEVALGQKVKVASITNGEDQPINITINGDKAAEPATAENLQNGFVLTTIPQYGENQLTFTTNDDRSTTAKVTVKQPQFEFASANVTTGENITAKVKGLQNGSNVQFKLVNGPKTENLGEELTVAENTATLNVKVPEGFENPGTKLVISGTTPAFNIEKDVTVQAKPAPEPAPEPEKAKIPQPKGNITIKLSSSSETATGTTKPSFKRNQQITITAEGFNNGDKVRFVLYSDPKVLCDSETANTEGKATCTSTIPADAEIASDHLVRAYAINDSTARTNTIELEVVDENTKPVEEKEETAVKDVNFPTGNGSIIVHKYQGIGTTPGDGNKLEDTDTSIKDKPVVKGVQFTLYKVEPKDGTFNLATAGGWQAVTAMNKSLEGATPSVTLLGEKGYKVTKVDGGEQTTDDKGMITYGNLTFGVYLLVETDASGATVNGKAVQVATSVSSIITLPLTKQEKDGGKEWLTTVNVYPKNEVSNFTKSVKDVSTVTSSTTKNILEYTLQYPVVLAAGDHLKTLTMSDTLPTGLTYAGGSLQITLGDTQVTNPADVLTAVPQDGAGQVSLEFKNDAIKGLTNGQIIKVVFKVKTGNTVTGNLTNGTKEDGPGNTKITFTTEKNDKPTDITPNDPTVSKYGDVFFKKVANSENGEALANAIFKLVYCDTPNETILENIKSADGENNTIKGEFKLTGLQFSNWYNNASQTTYDNKPQYCLVETQAPGGYELLPEPIAFSIVGDTAEAGQKQADVKTYKVQYYTGSNGNWQKGELAANNGENNKKIVNVTKNGGFTLPVTGATGLILFTLAGGLLIVGGVVYVIARRRREEA